MPKSDLPFDPDDYAPVAERIALFYERHPEGRIVTELLSPIESAEVVVRACVYRAQGDTLPAATGLASERKGDGDVNAVACLENTETSAIGRALANLGLTAARRRPSAEEMRKAARGRGRVPDRGVPPGGAASRVRRTAVVCEPGVDHALQARADAAADALDLLAEAERAGMRPARAARVRERLLHDRGLAADAIERLQVCLRRWLRREAERRRTPSVS